MTVYNNSTQYVLYWSAAFFSIHHTVISV